MIIPSAASMDSIIMPQKANYLESQKRKSRRETNTHTTTTSLDTNKLSMEVETNNKNTFSKLSRKLDAKSRKRYQNKYGVYAAAVRRNGKIVIERYSTTRRGLGNKGFLKRYEIKLKGDTLTFHQYHTSQFEESMMINIAPVLSFASAERTESHDINSPGAQNIIKKYLIPAAA